MSVRKVVLWVFAAVMSVVASSVMAATEIAPDIHLISGVTPHNAQPDGNSVIIDAPQGLIVFDTGRHAAHTQQVIDYAKAARRPVTAIINSHWHLDHTGGNVLLRAEYPDVRIYASSALQGALGDFLLKYRGQLAQAIAAAEKDPATQESLRTEMGLIDAGQKLAPTDVITSSGRQKIAGRGLDVHLEHAAVTAGDVWVLDPTTRVLMAGDLVTLPAPFLDTACPEHWKAALDRLAAIRFTVLIPGHGLPMRHAALDTYRHGFAKLLACAATTQPKDTCVDGWVRDAGSLIVESDRGFAKALVDYYMDAILRGNADKVAKLCSA
jgi:glyoxylase-like metal-dependent hydrolase (beta-lactamase superfamily II)